MSFNGFISYSHAADGRLAPAVQRGLHRLAKPWHRRRALWIFRDQTGLSVTPALWTSIQKALDNSEYFVLMASPEAAQSPWVNREIEHWVATKPLDRILPVVTDGEWRWDPVAKDFDAESTSVPAALRGVFAEEPLYLDLRWARDDRHLSLRHSRFREAVAQRAAPMHGVSKDDLEGEDVRQHRRAGRMRLSAVASLLVLTVLASVTGLSAVQNAARANASAVEARQQQKEASAQRGHAERFATEAQQQEEKARDQEARARAAAAEADRQEESARAQKALADKAKGDVKVQLDKADKAAARAKEQQRLAARQGVLARESAAESRKQQQRAKEQERIAREQERLAGEAGDEAAKQKKIARDQAKLATEAAAQARKQEQIALQQEKKAKAAGEDAARQQKIAISRRLVNQATAIVGDDPRTAFQLGAAAQKVDPSAEVKRDVAGLVASTRHVGDIADVYRTAHGPDGLLATVSFYGVASLWNVTDAPRPLRLGTVAEPGVSNPGVALSPDGKTLAIVWDQGGALWDVTDPANPARVAELPEGRHYSVAAFSPDGRTLATGVRVPTEGPEGPGGPEGPNGYAALWDVTDRTRPAELAVLAGGKMFAAYELVFSADSKTLVAAHREAVVWDVSDPAHPVKRSQIDMRDTTYGMAFSPSQPQLALGDSSGVVTVHNLEDPSHPVPLYTFTSGLRGNMSLAFTSDGRRLAAGFSDGTAIVWEVTLGDQREVARLAGRINVTSLGFTRDDRTLVTVEGSQNAVLWSMEDLAGPARRARLRAHETGVQLVQYAADGRSMVTTGWDGNAVFWDVPRGRAPVQQGIAPGGVPVRQATVVLHGGRRADRTTFSADLHTVVSADDEGRITMRDTTDPAAPQTFASMRLPFLPMDLKLSSDGRYLAIAGGGVVQLWDVGDHADLRRLSENTVGAGPTSLAFSPDGTALAVATSNIVGLWDIVADPSEPRTITKMADPSADVRTVAFAPSGNILAAGGYRTVILWDVTDRANPQRVSALTGHADGISRIAFNADGTTMAVGDRARWATLWDIAQPARPIRLSRIDSFDALRDGALTFSPDATTLAIGDDDGAGDVVLWDLARLNRLRADPAAFGCVMAVKGLTPAEWRRLIPELDYQPTCNG
ncbi:TIR domain-containing protein [Actinoplanes sp. NBRC 103695]|uniref:TIR domain-containing protein n=1 Tax=Actinoplanes sp. NBRC 103695 TaxID=3032202 RepID=UPI0024A1DF81|nr:TIR domain-containing protein [Actinoplanes sp. NBRC 103695]GLY93780.1 hypothetical protein Acsp02_10360 [Actinoplanes sp. NBRC 103695]